MQLIYQRGGKLANSKFDYSLVRPISGKVTQEDSQDDESQDSLWDESKIRKINSDRDSLNQTKPRKPKKGWEGIGEDIQHIPQGIGNFLGNIPKNASEGWGQLFSEPTRALKNVAAGSGEGAIGFLNSPHNFLKYLGEKEVIPDWLKKYNELPFTHIPEDLGVEKFIGLGDRKPGDIAFRQAGGTVFPSQIIPKVPGVKQLIAKRNAPFDKIRELKAKLEEHGLTYEEADSALKEIVGQNAGEFGGGNLPFKLKNAKEKSQEIEESLGNIGAFSKAREPKAPESMPHPELPQEHAYETQAPQTGSILKTKEEKMAATENAIKQGLGAGETHHLHYGTEIEKGRKAVEELNNKNYEPVNRDLKENNVVIKSPEDAKKVAQHVSDIIGSHDIWSKEVSDLPNQVEAMNKAEHIPADKYLRLYRDTQKAATDAYHDVKENGGTTKGEQAYERMKAIQALGGEMWSQLKTSIPEEAFKNLEKAQNFFKENVVPMRNNRTFHKIKTTGKHKGIIEANIGTDIGQDLLREMTFANPTALKHAVGEEFAKKPEKLFEANEELEKNYLPRMPWLKDLMHEHRTAKAEHAEAEKMHEQAKQHDIEQEKIAKDRLKERAAIIKAHEAKKSAIQKKYEEKRQSYLDKKAEEESRNAETRHNLEREKEKNQSKLDALEKRIPELEKAVKIEKQSLEAKHRAEMELREAKEKAHKLRTLMYRTLRFGYKVGRKVTTGK